MHFTFYTLWCFSPLCCYNCEPIEGSNLVLGMYTCLVSERMMYRPRSKYSLPGISLIPHGNHTPAFSTTGGPSVSLPFLIPQLQAPSLQDIFASAPFFQISSTNKSFFPRYSSRAVFPLKKSLTTGMGKSLLRTDISRI